MRRHLVPLCGFRYNAFVYENCILCSCAVRRDGAVRRCGVVRADGLRLARAEARLQAVGLFEGGEEKVRGCIDF